MRAVPEENVAVVVFGPVAEAEAAIRNLARSGFDMSKVSLAGRDSRPPDQVVGYYQGGDRMKYWGNSGGFWDGVWEMLTGWAFFALPATGPVLVAGPLSDWIVAGLDNAAIFGGLSAFGAALYSIGIGRRQIPEYEAALGAGKYLVLAYGTADEVSRARQILTSAESAGLSHEQRGTV